MRQLVRLYYLATPGFQFTPGRYAYYALCTALGLLAWRRPALAGITGLVESGANVGLLVIRFYVWYWSVLDAFGAEFAAVPVRGPEAVANFALAACMAGVSFVVHRARPA